MWQGPVPAVDHPLIDAADAAALKQQILDSGLTVQQLVTTTWAAASTFRGSDKRGGVNGARIRLEPQKSWTVNNPEQLASVLDVLEKIKAEFDAQGEKKVSIADLLVLAGNAGGEQAALAGGVEVEVPFTPGRSDASQEQTDVEAARMLCLIADLILTYHGVCCTSHGTLAVSP